MARKFQFFFPSAFLIDTMKLDETNTKTQFLCRRTQNGTIQSITWPLGRRHLLQNPDLISSRDNLSLSAGYMLSSPYMHSEILISLHASTQGGGLGEQNSDFMHFTEFCALV